MSNQDARRPRGEDRRRQILDAALEEFSASGIEGARIETIAERAGCNKSLVFYYFKNKDELLDAVMSEVMTSDAAYSSVVRSASFLEWVQYTVDWSWRNTDDHWVKMIAREGLNDHGRVVEEDARARALGESVRAVVRAQGSGEVGKDLDPELVTLMFLMMTIGPIITPQLVRMLTGMSPSDDRLHERFTEFMRVVTERLRPPESSI